MRNKLLLLKKILLLVIFTVLFKYHYTVAQTLTLPYVFDNVSEYADNEIYIGLVGKYPGMGDVWMNMLTSQLKVMSHSDNTVPGPAWANTPDGSNKYAAMFFKLSDIPNNTIQIPHGLFGCRIFLSFKSPMYIYFHTTGGYAGANLQNSSDPNDGIRWELVELTWGDAGLWTNTSRVDAYQYPMGLEVTGHTGGISGTYAQSYTAKINSGASPNVNKKIGELLSHQTILDMWQTKVDPAFYGCKVVKTHSMDGNPIIEQPSKIPDFKVGATYGNYFSAYIDDIWNTYRSKDLYLNIGDRGTWRGRVTGDRFDFYDPADNSQATIYWKPSTTDAIEGAGALATTYATGGTEKYHEDLMIQAQVCAAINRHAIYTNTADGVAQYNHDATRYFVVSPYNQYVKFFHSSEISYESQTYAFAYDDVGDHSSTIQCTFPTNVKVVIGGYGSAEPVVQEPYKTMNIPGIIEAEDYDLGGSGTAYSDATPTNEGGQYRTDAVDIEVCTEGGYNVGYTADNEWLEYTVNVTESGNYDFIIRSASESAGGKLHLEIDGSAITNSTSLPVTTGWQTWENKLISNIALTQGVHILRIAIEQGGFNLNKITVEKHNSGNYLHASGTQIVDGSGANFLIKGIGTGNWMIQEGYMMQSSDVAPTQHEFRDKLIATIGHDRTNQFYDKWLANHFRKIDVDSMAAWGFNTVRVAMHYLWFTLPIEDEPVAGQNTWLDKGFVMMDSLLKWCGDNNMYLILDMHGTPGGQGKNADISDYDPSKPSLWESEDNKNKLVALWKKLAERYKNEPWIGGYDMINETNWDFENSGNINGCACNSNTPLLDMHKRIIDAIRTVDNNHIVFVSGNCWGGNYNGMDALASYDSNLAYTFHKYWNYNDAGAIQGMLDKRQTLNVPMWMSESGENSNTWFTDAITLFESNNIGWSWWPVKKSGVNNILKIKTNADYTRLIEYWKGNGSMTADEAFNAVMTYAENTKFENCTIGYDVIDAMIRQPQTSATKAFKPHGVNQKIFVSDYDLGKTGYAYYDKIVANYHVNTGTFEAWNTGWDYRSDGVDIQASEDPESNGYCVGWTEAGEWLQYTFKVKTAATYSLNLRTASATTDGAVKIEIDGAVVLNSVTVPKTTGWQDFKTITLGNVALTPGEHKIRIVIETGDFNISYLEFVHEFSQTLTLKKGWNLVSTYLTPATPAVTVMFPNASIVKTSDSFYNSSQATFLNSLTEIEAGVGYLVYNSKEETLTIKGVETQSVASLHEGWNLIGVPVQSNFPVSSLPAETIIVKDFEGFYAPSGTMNSMTELIPGKAYFLKSSDSCIINF